MDVRAPTPVLDVSRLSALRLLRRDPIGLLERAAALGDVTRVPMPRVRVFVVNDPDLVWGILSTGHRDFAKSPTLKNARMVLGDGLLTAEGELHRRQRRLIQPLFHHARVAGWADAMVAEAVRAADRMPEGRSIDLHEHMARLTLGIVGRTVFGTDIEGDDAREVAAALGEVLSQFDRQFSPWLPLTARLPIPATRRFDRAVGVFDRVVYAMIQERRRSGSGDDLLSLLLHAQEDGEAMGATQVRDEAVTIILAGHETTSNALTWTWWLLSQHPEAEARLHAELDATLRGSPPTVEDLDRLPYTEAVLNESIRLRPPAWAIGRQAVSDHPMGERVLRRGAVAVVSPWLLHHDARWWPEPHAFRPDRWLRDDPSRPRHAFLPFGGGPRMCVGEGFAWTEARLVIATLAQRWRFRLDPSARVELQPVITLRPRFGMTMRATRRSAPTVATRPGAAPPKWPSSSPSGPAPPSAPPGS